MNAPHPSPPDKPPHPLQKAIGQQARALRLQQNLSQSSVAQTAGVALGALKNLEAGHGATLHTWVQVAQALGYAEALLRLLPEVARSSPVSPLTTGSDTRQRAGKPRTPRP